jgi:cysteine desulfurase
MTGPMPVYLDCNATTPVEEEVIEAMNHYLRVEYGNAGSRTHRYGTVAAQAVKRAREQVASVVNASWENVIFTSGATESNNISILGLANQAEKLGRKHIISTQIEHKAVLEPLEQLAKRGFEVTLLPPTSDGAVQASAVESALRDDTVLVSVMHVNNETGVIQPLNEIADVLRDHAAVLHTDSAQGFGKELDGPRNDRVDLISVSSHKIYGPKGIGALIIRPTSRTSQIHPLTHGGGQERGLRPGTVPVHLVAALGVAAELAKANYENRRNSCLAFRRALLEAIGPLQPTITGNLDNILPNVLNLRFGLIDSEAIMIALKDLVAISNGSACTSNTYKPSHVLRAMRLTDSDIHSATRWSWCHLTPTPSWGEIKRRLASLT